jgi:hypothetical protein
MALNPSDHDHYYRIPRSDVEVILRYSKNRHWRFLYGSIETYEDHTASAMSSTSPRRLRTFANSQARSEPNDARRGDLTDWVAQQDLWQSNQVFNGIGQESGQCADQPFPADKLQRLGLSPILSVIMARNFSSCARSSLSCQRCSSELARFPLAVRAAISWSHSST